MVRDRFGGDLVGEGANLELVVAEEVGVVRSREVRGQLADLAVDGLVDRLGQVLDLGLLLRRKGRRCHGASGASGGFSSKGTAAPLCTKIPPTFKTLAAK